MSSSDESAENIEAEDRNVMARLSSSTKKLYFWTYEEFIKWKNSRSSVAPFSEDLFLEYFSEMSQSKKPKTLWYMYSMLKAMVRVKHDIHINTFKSLLTFLKNQSKRHSKKSKTFTSPNIDTFLKEAPDDSYLALKVALIVGVNGACHRYELSNVTVNDIQKHSDHLSVVILPSTKTKRSFVISRNEEVAIVEKYLSLRPADMETNRLFLHCLNGRCTKQVIGKNKIGAMPKQIAKYLKLPNPELYTGHCFRNTAAALSIPAYHQPMGVERCGVWPWVQQDAVASKATSCLRETSPLLSESNRCHEVIIKQELDTEIMSIKEDSEDVPVTNIKVYVHKIKRFDSINSPTEPWVHQDAVASKATSCLREMSPLLTESNRCLSHEVIIKQELDTEIVSNKEDSEEDVPVTNIKVYEHKINRFDPINSPTEPWVQQDAVASISASCLREMSPLLTESNHCLNHEVIIKQELDTEIVSIKEDSEDVPV